MLEVEVHILLLEQQPSTFYLIPIHQRVLISVNSQVLKPELRLELNQDSLFLVVGNQHIEQIPNVKELIHLQFYEIKDEGLLIDQKNKLHVTHVKLAKIQLADFYDFLLEYIQVAINDVLFVFLSQARLNPHVSVVFKLN